MEYKIIAHAQLAAGLRLYSKRSARALGVACFAMTLAACDSAGIDPSGDEGGIIGTGITLEGTASSTQTLATQTVEIKSKTGQSSQVSLDQNQHFSTNTAGGNGPWLMRVSTGEDQYLYGLSYGDGTSNINSYTDLILRNWYARTGQNIKQAFDSTGAIAALPTQAEFLSTESSVFKIVQLVLQSYEVDGSDIVRGDLAPRDSAEAVFLAQNPVVTADNIVTYLVTDPQTQTQSSLASQLMLNRNFAQQESTEPTAPSSVRALGSGPNEMLVVWNSASDDTAVASYEISRDGSRVAVSPYPIYVDTNVQAGREYSYSIVAVDVWGNRSSASELGRGQSLTTPDNVPPQKPSMLLAPVVNSRRVELIWGVSDVSDVVKFVLYRGASTENAQTISQLTSNYATDINVSANNAYCYQVSAQDASGNLSERSEALCLQTPAAAGQSAELGGNNLVIPDVQSMACDTVLSNADVADGAVVSAGCYQVSTDLVLNPGANLTLLAGTVLKFEEGTGIYIGQNASISSLGTQQSPVVLTGVQQIPGTWHGLTIDRSNSRANLIRSTVIEYAGGSAQESAIHVISRTGELTRFRLEDSLLQWSSGYGLQMADNGTVVELFTGNVLANNQRPAALGVQYLASVATNNSFSGNTEDFISIGRNSFDYAINIPDIGVPLRSNGFNMTGAPLNIQPGVEMLFYSDSNTEISIEGNSKLTAKGTTDKPILLQAENGVSGSWGGISIASNADNVLEHVLIENAGGTTNAYPSNVENGALRLNCTQPSPAKLSVTNSQIALSASWGIYQDASGCAVDIDNSVQFIDNTLGDIRQP